MQEVQHILSHKIEFEKQAETTIFTFWHSRTIRDSATKCSQKHILEMYLLRV